MQFKHPRFKYVFLAIDIIILTVSLLMALYIVMPDFASVFIEDYLVGLDNLGFFILLLVIYIFSLRFNNLYKRKVITTHYRQFVLIIKSLMAGTFVSILLMVFSNMEYFRLYGKDLITNIFLFSLVLFTLIRAFLGLSIYNVLAKRKILRIKVLIVGGDDAGKFVARQLEQDPIADFEIVGFLDDYKKVGIRINERFLNLGNLKDIDQIVKELNPDEILIAIDNAPYERLIYIVEKSLQTGKSVKIYSDLVRVISEKMDVEHYSNIPVISLEQKPLDAPEWSRKRRVDLLLSSVALIVLSPLFLIVAIGIKISSRGPVIFKQKRIGKDGRPFDFYKFRSMHVGNSDSRHREYVQDFIKNNNSHCERGDIKVFKITDDPRIFRFGKFIRKTSIDEFPQFFNVLKGDMSLVGPRPCLDYEWQCYEPWHKERLKGLPGCTGLWQTLGRSTVTFEEMVILDLYYISNMSLWMDLRIVLQTLPVIFLGRGGH